MASSESPHLLYVSSHISIIPSYYDVPSCIDIFCCCSKGVIISLLKTSNYFPFIPTKLLEKNDISYIGVVMEIPNKSSCYCIGVVAYRIFLCNMTCIVSLPFVANCCN